ncbi:glycosyltransferase [Primorskyibacter aestuariivivens]|uniref:glycosyltransferase n=1 Tax=Primorskyibacter aestuariivivens TaxID=1888912 RepID=UPI0022FFDAD6|nr:glycosyltransferase [Primorskyibacter aestuariivivens]MDA7429635.1 glycosyltransferase [Primorskyibacter aestuariivivens]
MPGFKVLIVLHAFADGGAEAVFVRLANDLHRRGIAVTLVAANAVGPNRARLNDAIEVVDLRAQRMLTAIPALVQTLRRLRPSACISALTHTNLALLLVAGLARSDARIVISERRSLTAEFAETPGLKAWIKRRAIGWLYPRADAIVTVSEALRSEIDAMLLPASATTVTIRNPVDTARLQHLAREMRFDRAGDGALIVCVGRLVPQKNLPMLLRAFAILNREHNARLIIAGDGPLRGALEALARDLSITDLVEFAGYLENPYGLMARADILALSSDFEGLPNVLIEGLALGVQIVSTDCPTGPAEILGQGRFGRLVPVGDANAMAEALTAALDAPLDYDREAALRPYQPERVFDAYLDVLQGGP